MKLSLRETRVLVFALTLLGLSVLGWGLVAWAGPETAQTQPLETPPLTLPPSEAQAAAAGTEPKVKRVGSVVGLNEETMQQYILLHEHTWPEVLKRIADSHIRNYSIFAGQLDDNNYYLFSYFEYVGDDFDADMAAMAQDPVTRDWWKLTDPLQRRLPGTPVGEQWKRIKQVFHTD